MGRFVPPGYYVTESVDVKRFKKKKSEDRYIYTPMEIYRWRRRRWIDGNWQSCRRSTLVRKQNWRVVRRARIPDALARLFLRLLQRQFCIVLLLLLLFRPPNIFFTCCDLLIICWQGKLKIYNTGQSLGAFPITWTKQNQIYWMKNNETTIISIGRLQYQCKNCFSWSIISV